MKLKTGAKLAAAALLALSLFTLTGCIDYIINEIEWRVSNRVADKVGDAVDSAMDKGIEAGGNLIDKHRQKGASSVEKQGYKVNPNDLVRDGQGNVVVNLPPGFIAVLGAPKTDGQTQDMGTYLDECKAKGWNVELHDDGSARLVLTDEQYKHYMDRLFSSVLLSIADSLDEVNSLGFVQFTRADDFSSMEIKISPTLYRGELGKTVVGWLTFPAVMFRQAGGFQDPDCIVTVIDKDSGETLDEASGIELCRSNPVTQSLEFKTEG